MACTGTILPFVVLLYGTNKGKGKGKVHPRRGQEAQRRSRGIALLFI
jgi:hypothetical protein